MLTTDGLRVYVQASGLGFRENATSFVFECPRCRKRKLYVSKTTGRFACMRCKDVEGFQGRPEYAFAEMLGVPVDAAKTALYGHSAGGGELFLDIELADPYGFVDAPAEEPEADEPAEVAWPFDYYPIGDPRAKRGADYLAGRGVPAEVAARYGVRYSPEERSVVFPVESGGRLRGWQRRLVTPTSWVDQETGEVVEVPKSPTMSGMRRDRLLMFGDRLKGSEHAVVCEGPIDAIKADLCGGNVATMGKAASQFQLGLIRASGVRRVYLALDPDAADQMERAAREFHDLELRSMTAPQVAGAGKNDLGAMTFQEVKELFDSAPAIGAGRLFVYVEPPR
jgi:hypothetical protein